MVYEPWRIPYSEDELNRQNLRNMENTDKTAFNCGGYALGTFSWYEPNDAATCPWDIFCQWSMDYMKRLTGRCVNFMLKDFPDLRVIHTVNDIQTDEYAIAFRVSSNGDFHYLKRVRAGVWHHKMGGTCSIETISEKEVFSSEWLGMYDGPIVLFAKKLRD